MLNKFRENFIQWDRANKKIYEKIRVNASDANGQKIVVQIVNDGVVEDLTGAVVSLYWETPNAHNNTVRDIYKHKGLDGFNPIDATKGMFELYFKTGMLSNVGNLNAALVLVDDLGRVVSDWFNVEVTRGIDDEAIESSDSFTALTQALQTVNQYDDIVESLQNTKAEKTVVDSLSGRVLTVETNKLNKTQYDSEKVLLENAITALQNEKSNKAYNKVIDFSPLPIYSNGTYGWNGMAFTQDNLTTYNGNQYGVIVGSNKTPIVFKRSLETGKVSTFDIGSVPALATTFALPAEENEHCVFVIAVDKNGYIHIAGNMHADPIRYVVSNSPENINAWNTKGMTGQGEGQVTYPSFVKRRNGDLLFFYRNGISSSSNVQLNKYNANTQNWEKVQTNLLDGRPTSEGVYYNHIAVDSSDVIHMMFMWRTLSGGGITNSDVGYAKSSDGGITWKRTNGTTYTLPITHNNQEVAMPSSGRGLLNQSGLEADGLGRPHGAFLQNDSSGKTQIYHVWHDGTRWYNTVKTAFGTTMSMTGGLLDGTFARPSVVATADNRVYIIYRKNDEGYRGALRMIDSTPNAVTVDFKLMDVDLHEYEPVIDTQALYERNELSMVVGTMVSRGSGSSKWNNADNWNTQMCGVLTVDLKQVETLGKGAVQIPTIKTLSTFTGVPQAQLTVTNTTLSDLPISGLIVDKDLKGKNVFVRLKARTRLMTGATTLTVRLVHTLESQSGGGITNHGTFVQTSIDTGYHITPWIPLRNLSDYGSFVTVYGNVDGGEARISLLEIELGILEN